MATLQKTVNIYCENCGKIDPEHVDLLYVSSGGRCLVCGGRFFSDQDKQEDSE